MSLFPETFTTGKMIDGVPVPTHLIYNPGAAITKYESYQRSLVQTQHPQPKFSVQEIPAETLPTKIRVLVRKVLYKGFYQIA